MAVLDQPVFERPMLSDSDLERYARQVIMPSIGEDGQEQLLAAKVLIVGAGGLGAPVILYLAAAGIGHITIIDDDLVSRSDLNRQIIYREKDVGASLILILDMVMSNSPKERPETFNANNGASSLRPSASAAEITQCPGLISLVCTKKSLNA